MSLRKNVDLRYLSDLFSVLRRGPNTKHPNMGNVFQTLCQHTCSTCDNKEISMIDSTGFGCLSKTTFS